MTIASLLGRATSAVTLDDIELGFGSIAFRAVRQLAGQGQAFQSRFANNQVAGFTGSITGTRRGQAFLNDRFCGGRVFFQESVKNFADNLLDIGLHFRIHQLDLSLAFKLWVRMFDTDYGSKTLTGIVS